MAESLESTLAMRAQEAARIPGVNSGLGDIPRDDGTHPDECVIANANIVAHQGADSDPASVSDAGRARDSRLDRYRAVLPNDRVCADDAQRADLRSFADNRLVDPPALNDGVGADIDVILKHDATVVPKQDGFVLIFRGADSFGPDHSASVDDRRRTDDIALLRVFALSGLVVEQREQQIDVVGAVV